MIVELEDYSQYQESGCSEIYFLRYENQNEFFMQSNTKIFQKFKDLIPNDFPYHRLVWIYHAYKHIVPFYLVYKHNNIINGILILQRLKISTTCMWKIFAVCFFFVWLHRLKTKLCFIPKCE